MVCFLKELVDRECGEVNILLVVLFLFALLFFVIVCICFCFYFGFHFCGFFCYFSVLAANSVLLSSYTWPVL